MRPIRILALAVPALAIATSTVPATAAVAAQTAPGRAARPALTGVTWHNLTLLNGWQSSSDGARTPAWAVSNGIVYLSGIIKQPPSGTSPVVAQLPSGARPTMTQYAQIAAYHTFSGYLTISPGGVITVGSQQYVNEKTATSLGGVSFPAAATARHKLTLVNGWQAAPGQGAPAYTVAGGMVHLSGDLKHTGTGTSNVFASLPAGTWPAHNQYIEVFTQGGITGELVVGSNGKLTAHWGLSGIRTSLASATFPLASTAIKTLPLRNGWKPAAASLGTGNPGYSQVAGVVCLSGALNGATATSSTFAALPTSIRPQHTVVLIADIKNGAGAMIGLGSTGLNTIDASDGLSAKQLTSLASVCYPINS